jgi:hypothetical protein
VNTLDTHFEKIERDLTVLKWMMAATLVIEIALLVKVFST